jgi:hypothetical protein
MCYDNMPKEYRSECDDIISTYRFKNDPTDNGEPDEEDRATFFDCVVFSIWDSGSRIAEQPGTTNPNEKTLRQVAIQVGTLRCDVPTNEHIKKEDHRQHLSSARKSGAPVFLKPEIQKSGQTHWVFLDKKGGTLDISKDMIEWAQRYKHNPLPSLPYSDATYYWDETHAQIVQQWNVGWAAILGRQRINWWHDGSTLKSPKSRPPTDPGNLNDVFMDIVYQCDQNKKDLQFWSSLVNN